MSDPYKAVENARQAINDLLDEVAALSATLAVVYRAWTEMDPNHRRELASQHPALVNALLLMEGRQFERVQRESEAELVAAHLGERR